MAAPSSTTEITTATGRRAEQRYRPEPTAPAQARAFVDEFLTSVGAPELDERAELLTAEMVADAVRHAPSQVVVRIAFDRGGLRVEISDDPGIIADPAAGKADRERTRRHADTMASRWGSSYTRDTTTTWFELAA